MINPNRGEVWLVDLGLAAKIRPYLVVSSPYQDEDRALIFIVGHTISARGPRFEVAIMVPFLRTGVFDTQTILTIPRAKFMRKLGVLSPENFALVENSIRSWLGF